jgi:hypothetical protein
VDWPASPDVRTEHNLLERPVFREALEAVAEGTSSTTAFLRAYPFDVSPADDDRPYFGQFVRLTSLPVLLARERAAWLPVAEWGYLAVLATLVQSAALAVLLLAVPVAVLRRRRSGSGVRLARTALYFGAIGFGFMSVELAAIQRLGLVLGHPVLAASATLAALLVYSGLGSALSDRFPSERTAAACALVAAAAVALSLAAPGAAALVSWSFPARASVSLLVLLLPGVLMGAPFPLGLRRLAPEPTALAWAWAANGVASVVGASLATLLAMEIGGRGLILVGGACYALAAAATLSPTRERSTA